MVLSNLKLMLQGKSKSPKPSLPNTSELSDAHELTDDLSSNILEAHNFAAPTMESTKITHLYRETSSATRHLRLYARFLASLQGLRRRDPIARREVLRVNFPIRVVIKYGTDIRLSEASTLRFLAKTTSIPVPKIYCAFEHKGTNFIMMEYMKGETIRDVWNELSPAIRTELLQQLKGHFEELRNIPHPRPGTICALDGGPLIDRRIVDDEFGPFANEKDFNNFLRCGINEIDNNLSNFDQYYFGQDISVWGPGSRS
ncbi:hypothetical protein LSUE1_G005288 [Lachnellula suecica]|uniref:Aminoglycoside phosphotransferase domain-containing protein n=1 Tax=Lachnellula suecica TaxID=602035 RepID=A0A8T9CEH5_9HELO|nr:hypothetical protein LSUE1_G005288 [Lachnellula suecica]